MAQQSSASSSNNQAADTAADVINQQQQQQQQQQERRAKVNKVQQFLHRKMPHWKLQTRSKLHNILARKPTETEVRAERAREREEDQHRGTQIPFDMYEDELVDDMQLDVDPMPIRRTKREIIDARLQLLHEDRTIKRPRLKHDQIS
ncbi:hypothetical protein O0I10_006816 [Lichtheimia ornata]|uniref:Uncharacterized protein n=1 Tax=Lichtheimia ornata TaxID=688661 RepID=A0AAD7XUI9_9FUNG|nr:uncharacterized protein O0I10_006816 [Lichtheimia ornata]KAJ8657514.1 hypothetical protein O0I10_006816 [Lichtheimia ornata]